ncbi:hypothetical protein BH09ACT12_BH09ACT12_07190 [soil metagenome]
MIEGGPTLLLVDLILSALDALGGPGDLLLGTVALLALVTVTLVAARFAVRRLAVTPAATTRTTRPAADRRPPLLSNRVTDTLSHPRRPRAPGIA